MPCYIDDMFKAPVPARNSKPPNRRMEEVRHRWEADTAPFGRPDGVEDPMVRGGLLLPSQTVLDSFERKGATLHEYYQVNPPSSLQPPLKLTDALKKVTYGKLFQNGFPVAYDTRSIRTRHVREELTEVLRADPGGKWCGGRGRAFVNVRSPSSSGEEDTLASCFCKVTVTKTKEYRSLLTEGIVGDDDEEWEDDDDTDDGPNGDGHNPGEEWSKLNETHELPVVPPCPAPHHAISNPLTTTTRLLPVSHEMNEKVHNITAVKSDSHTPKVADVASTRPRHRQAKQELLRTPKQEPQSGLFLFPPPILES